MQARFYLKEKKQMKLVGNRLKRRKVIVKAVTTFSSAPKQDAAEY